MSNRKRIITVVLGLALSFILCCEMLFSVFILRANAADNDKTEYTNAYDDLRKSNSFDAEAFPQLAPGDEGYYSLELITISESDIGELFVYVYQPSGYIEDLRATSINISTKIRGEKDYKNYTLTFLNYYGVFYKYKVDEFVVSSDEKRYYEIPSIFRTWNKEYDVDPGNDNTVSEQDFAVGKQFTFETVNSGGVISSVEDVEYIEVTEKFVGYRRYENSSIAWGIISAHCDSHFVAFSTDREIDKLLEADVFFEKQVYFSTGISLEPWSDITQEYVYLTSTQEGGTIYGDFFEKKEASWNRIQTTSEFLKMQDETEIFSFPGFSESGNANFSDEDLEKLSKTEWVLNFVETKYNFESLSGSQTLEFSRVGNVSILRLKFETDGVTYDLGVVDNKQTGSSDPALTIEGESWWQKLMAVIMLILLLLIISFIWNPLSALLKFVFGIIWFIIKSLFNLIFKILTLPFRLFSG